MEYPQYGIYELPEIVKSKQGKKKTFNSLPLKASKRLVTESTCPNGVIKQIYYNINILVNFMEDMGELIDHRVIV
jgi:hypothetical protein